MTKNQIAYAELLEKKRANKVNETLTEARDLVNKALGFGNLEENIRHNKQQEVHNVHVLGETQRHNLISESISKDSLAETSRHNLANEMLDQQKIAETIRSNQAREYETQRSNKAREGISYAELAERRRSNMVHEGLQAQEVQLKSETLRETKRHNRKGEMLTANQIKETVRSNLANEDIRNEVNKINRLAQEIAQGNLDEKTRANKVTEILQALEFIRKTANDVYNVLSDFTF